MTAERLAMRQIRDILRQKWALGLSHRAVTQSLGVGLGTITSVLTRARAAGLDWPQVQALPDTALESRLYGRLEVAGQRQRPAPDCTWIHAERRRPGVTLELLHLEYLERHPDGYRYTRFCDLYRRWLRRRRLSMRQVHRAGDKCFVDYAGQKPRLIDPITGAVGEVELFAAVLGASNYTYAEATRTQQVPDWIASHARAFAYFGGVTAAVVCDQLKSGVVVPCRYEPGLQRTYEEFAAHYGTAILPARPAHPRDKAKIEVAVQIAERWILARLRHETFFALAAMEDLDRRGAEARVDDLVEQGVGDGVIVALDLDVVVDVDAGDFPLAVDEGLGRQRAERGLIEAFEELAATGAVHAHRPRVEVGDQFGDRPVQFGKREEAKVAQPRQYPALDH